MHARLTLCALLALAATGCDDDPAGEPDAMMAPDATPDATPDAMPDVMTDAMDGTPDARQPDPDGGPDAGPGPCTPAAAADPTNGLLHTTEGAVQGERIGDTWRYLALPFAAPPVGPLRWRPPAPPACHDGVHFTTTYGPACPQLEDGAYLGDEDCLHLNIWTPAAAPADGAPRPVLFFIHGGGNVQGSATVGIPGRPLYDGQRLAERFGVVVVVTQYRLGPLAWLVHPALADAAGRSGNHGTRDQIAALDWIRRNIAAFGGDPARVTLFGESAGGRNICTLIASPPAAGLFHGAIIQSGGCVQPSPEQVAAVGLEIITAAGCADAPDIDTCLRTLGARELLEARPPIVEVAGRSDALQPYADGEILLGQPEDIIAAGQHNDVPIIIGANADETSTSTPPIATEAAYEAALRATLGPLTDRVLELYPASDYDSPQAAYIQVTTDAKFVCGARRAARAAATGGQSPAYLYHFTQNLSRSPRLAPAGAYHGVELFFVWQQMDFANYRATPEETALAEAMGGYWTRFAATGTPGGPPDWPAYEAATDEALVFHGDGIEVIAGIREAKCDFWDSLDPRD